MNRVVFLVLCLVLFCSGHFVLSKVMTCPPTISVDICHASCGPYEEPCPGAQVCCPTSCGGSMCVDPVTERRFVNFVKPGRCPENPRGPWVCTDTCSGDFDCPKKLKCCTNRCGVFSCQRPETD